MIAINLSKQQVLDIDLKTTQQINFIRNLDRDGNKMFFIIEKEKKTFFGFFMRNCESIAKLH